MKIFFEKTHFRNFFSFFLLAFLCIISSNINFLHAKKPTYAAFVMEAYTGKILHSVNATTQVPPASLTKIMTLYILFEELAAQRLHMNSVIVVSKKAARQLPSKLGIPAGGKILVKEALLSLMTRSANDMAVAVAEKVSGTEEAFVQRMNNTAHALNMTRTVFKNPSGLPNSQQLTTAHDMALLSQALLKKFPDYYRYFNTKIFNYKGQKINNHNKLLGKFEGLDGIKTGFTCLSGFNIATSAVRNGQRLIGVVMGGETGKWRDQRISQLLEASFLKVPHKNNSLLLQPSPPMDDCTIQVSAKPKTLKKSSQKKAVYSETVENTVQYKELDTLFKNIENTPEPEDWFVQVGTYKKAKDAHIGAALLLAKLPKKYNPKISVLKADLKRSRLYRARLGSFNKSTADKISALLKNQGVSCLVVKDPTRAKLQTAMVVTG